MNSVKALPWALASAFVAAPMHQVQAQGAVALEEVVVTARKTEESLQDVPVSVSAFSAEELFERSIENLTDVALFTPGLTYENYSTAFGAPVIRGLSQTRLTNPVQNVSTFIDGIYLQRSYQIDVGTLDMARIEVIKGAQSALYGRNSFAGAINYVTEQPGDETRGYAQVTAGTDERLDFKAGISGALVPDKLYGRIGVGISEYDGTWTNNHPFSDLNISPGSEGNLGGWDNQAFNAMLRFEATEDLDFELAYYNTDTEYEQVPNFVLSGLRGVGFGLANFNDINCAPGAAFSLVQGTLIFGNQLYCGTIPDQPPQIAGDPRVAAPAVDPRAFGTYADTDIVRFSTEWRFAENYRLFYQYGDTGTDVQSGGDASRDSVNGSPIFGIPAPFLFFDAQPQGGLDSEQHELRVEFDNGDFRWMGGYYYSSVDDNYISWGYLPTILFSRDNVRPITEQPIFGTPNDTTRIDHVRALFGMVEFDIGDRWSASIEARYTDEAKKIEGPSAPGLPPRDFSYFTPRFTLDYEMSDDVLLYGSLAKGVKAGGFNRLTVEPSQRSYDEEENWSGELGIKTTLRDGSLRLNAALYYIDWSDLQINEPEIGGSPISPVVVGNIGGAESYGLEVDGLWRLSETLTFNFGLSLNNPTFDDDVVYIESVRGGWCANTDVCRDDGFIGGNTLSRTSEEQAMVGLAYEQNLDNGWQFFARADAAWQSEQYTDFLNAGQIPSRTLVNATVGLRADAWEARLWSKNLFDEEYARSSFFLGFSNSYVVYLGEQQTFGVDFRYNFQ